MPYKINPFTGKPDYYQEVTGVVTSVSGTANRITVTGTTTPVVDIAATYVGQSSITTLGTITTGTWNGTVVTGQYGGTGVANTGKTITLGGSLTTSGAFASTFTMTGVTAVTFPTSGTLATTGDIPTLPLSLANGGTNASLVASNGGIFYSTGTAGAILSGTATANKVLMSGSSAAPVWSTPTYPNASVTAGKVIISDGTNYVASTPTFPNSATGTGTLLRADGTNWVASTATYPGTTTANQILYSSATNTVGEITAVNNGVLITSNAGVPSLLANGTAGHILTANSGAPPSWQAAPAGGIPTIGTSTDRAIVTWSGTGGNAVLNNSTLTVNAGGQILSGNSTASAPSYAFSADTNSGLYKTSGDSVGLSNGGVGWFTIDSGGGTRCEGTLTVANELTCGASVNVPLTTGAGNLTDVDNGVIFGFTDTSAPRTMTLSSGSSTGRVLIVKDQSGGAGTNNITISVNGGVKTIDGSTSYVINTNYGSVRLYYNGTNYFTF